jgi:hypothetical protein
VIWLIVIIVLQVWFVSSSVPRNPQKDFRSRTLWLLSGRSAKTATRTPIAAPGPHGAVDMTNLEKIDKEGFVHTLYAK